MVYTLAFIQKYLNVVYLGAAQPKLWSKESFLCKMAKKMQKGNKFAAKFRKKKTLFYFAPKCWSKYTTHEISM